MDLLDRAAPNANHSAVTVHTGYEADQLSAKPEKGAPFRIPGEELPNFGKIPLMDEQEDLYMADLTAPEPQPGFCRLR